MPIYNFSCNSCQKEFECLTKYDETGVYSSVKCEFCGSQEKTKLVTACNYNFKEVFGTDKWCDDYNGHQYRYDYNKEYVVKQREFAEKNSHVGPKPYNTINDLADNGLRSTPDLFGDVK